MTIQDIVRELNITEFQANGQQFDAIALYKSAVKKVVSGKLEDARQDIKKAIRLDPEFDEAKLLLSLVTFATGNRIEGLKLVNDIENSDLRMKAMSYIDRLSGIETSKIPETKKPEESDVFSKRYNSAKQAQEQEFIQRREELSKDESEKQENKGADDDFEDTKPAASNVLSPIEQMIAEQKSRIEAESKFNPILPVDDDSEPTDKTVIATDDVPQLIVNFKLDDELEEIKPLPEENNEDEKLNSSADKEDDEEYTKENVIDKKKVRRAIAIIAVCVGILAVISFIAIKFHLG